MYCVLGKFSAQQCVASTSWYRTDCISWINKGDGEREILLGWILSNTSLQEFSDVVIGQITWSITLLYLCYLFVRINKTFFRTLSYHNQTISLFFDSTNHLIIQTFFTMQFKWQLRNQTKVNGVVCETCLHRNEPTVPTHKFDKANSIHNRFSFDECSVDHPCRNFNTSVKSKAEID
jgi:hypothetical protein